MNRPAPPAYELPQRHQSSRASGDRNEVEAAIAQLADGSAAILTDRPDDPTFGEIVIAATRITTAATAFAIRHTSGFLQVALPGERCDHLLLPGQTGTNPASRQCVTVDASFGIGTGISGADRALTIRLLAAQDSSPDSFTRPGHVVPIRVDMHHSQSPYGAPEAAIHIAMAAGLAPAAVIATIVSSDRPAEIATGTELRSFARTQGLPLVGIGDSERHFMPKRPNSDLRQLLQDLRCRPMLARAHS